MRIFLLLTVFFLSCNPPIDSKKSNSTALAQNPKILSYEINLQHSQLNFYYKDEQEKNFGNHKRLRAWLAQQNKRLLFSVNGGMYNKDGSPQGLYIENGKELKAIDRQEAGYGNFYLQPNGIFCINNNNTAEILQTSQLKDPSQIKFATQSGPMLIIDGKLHPKFRKGSKNMHIRNGVGLLPNGHLLFAMSKEKINFYDFAQYFKDNDCTNALYLDGFVSRTYLPSKDWLQEDGNFGVIIAEIETIN